MPDTHHEISYSASALRDRAAALHERRLIHDTPNGNTSVLRELVTMGRDIALALADDLERMANRGN